MHIKRLETFQFNQHFVQFEIEIDSSENRTIIKSEPRTIFDLLNLNENPKHSTFRYANRGYAIQAPLENYYWDNIKFVKAPGNGSIWVKYDHPDNYDTYNPGLVNEQYYLNGESRLHHHITKGTVQDLKSKADFITGAGSIGAAIGVLLALPEPVVSKTIAALIGIPSAIATIYGVCLRVFTQQFLETELGDGWAWTWGEGKYVFLGFLALWWFWISFGALRDIGFFVLIWNISFPTNPEKVNYIVYQPAPLGLRGVRGGFAYRIR